MKLKHQGSKFFFEKKNQKTFARWSPSVGQTPADKGLFASFSSEKEGLPCFLN
ncbi:MAG: hypothetical protein NT133_09580 [Alphaproteobacteria bacterium]|nr:hypothetical protein [Alphaproteobacteria bacterium]